LCGSPFKNSGMRRLSVTKEAVTLGIVTSKELIAGFVKNMPTRKDTQGSRSLWQREIWLVMLWIKEADPVVPQIKQKLLRRELVPEVAASVKICDDVKMHRLL